MHIRWHVTTKGMPEKPNVLQEIQSCFPPPQQEFPISTDYQLGDFTSCQRVLDELLNYEWGFAVKHG